MKGLRTESKPFRSVLSPRFSVLFFLLLALLGGAARAHYVMEHELGGVVLCLEPSSVQVMVRGDGRLPDEVVEGAIHRRLSRFMHDALPRYGVAHERRASCAGHPAFVLLHLLVFHAGSEALADDYSYTYTVSVQVGEHPGAATAVEETLPQVRYAAISSFIYSEEETGQSFQSFLPGLAETFVRDLVSAWWLDNPLPASRPAFSPAALLAGVVLAFAAALVSWQLSPRRRPSTSRRPRRQG